MSDAEFLHPPGLSIIRALATALGSEGWSLSDFENWRDCGWSLGCNRQEAKLFVALAQTEERKWVLQISPLRVPGPFGRLFGERPSATPQDVLVLAQAIHSLLLRQSGFSHLKWRWDGYPEATSSNSEPEGLPQV